jgi:hypothetical protein
MNTLTIIALAVLILVLVTFSVLLAEKVNRLRLGKMLAALGVDIDVYLNSERSLEIQQHIDRCAACGNTAECDDKLAKQDIDPDHIGFCNNEASLREIAKK